ncbi:MAG TPA: hypothetical protein VGM62_15145, partial [Chthoniobacterales bacterium]
MPNFDAIERAFLLALDELRLYLRITCMKPITCLAITSCTLWGLALTALAGSDALRDSKDIKQVVVEPTPPTLCDWAGFYIGLHSGAEFGHSSTHDFATGRVFGYEESGFNGGL